ncbi:MAG: MazG nucleotide pyrophosphohydrolase domain-containing protein [Candidatus Gracilibacteria bacterium]
MHKKIKSLSAKRIKFFVESKIPFYKGHQTFLDGLKEEIQEAEEEIKNNNSVHLEDELGDVFWDYICLLHALENEGKISSIDNVLERCYKKFSGRILENGAGNGDWNEVKNKQKEELKIEHNRLYNNDEKIKL